jgi:hypothetical protein
MFGILEKIQFENSYSKRFGRQSACSRATPHSCATSSLPYPGCTRTPRRQKTQQSEASVVATVHLRLMTCANGLCRCHAACAHSLAGEPPSTIGCRLHRTSPPPRAHAGAPVGYEGRAKLPRHIVQPIKPLPLLPSRVPESPLQSAVAHH